ncbi:MAG: dephospho-CoA kinase [Acidimicrobiales bacterium]
MIPIGLTGGIGSGKSTVSSMMAARGAVIIDADKITRDLQRPNTEVFVAMVDRFGPEVVASDGTLDRPKLASIVFADPVELRALNEIVHPAVGQEIGLQLEAQALSNNVVILDVPLLAEGKGRYPTVGVVVVDIDEDVAVQRLVEHRGFTEADVRARMKAQAGREQRLAIADRVIENSGSLESLRVQVEETFLWAQRLPRWEKNDV